MCRSPRRAVQVDGPARLARRFGMLCHVLKDEQFHAVRRCGRCCVRFAPHRRIGTSRACCGCCAIIGAIGRAGGTHGQLASAAVFALRQNLRAAVSVVRIRIRGRAGAFHRNRGARSTVPWWINSGATDWPGHRQIRRPSPAVGASRAVAPRTPRLHDCRVVACTTGMSTSVRQARPGCSSDFRGSSACPRRSTVVSGIDAATRPSPAGSCRRQASRAWARRPRDQCGTPWCWPERTRWP